MDRKNQRLDNAAKQLADLIEANFEKLSPEQRERKSQAFHDVVAKIGNRAKSSSVQKPLGAHGL
jgi:hypothetical protein